MKCDIKEVIFDGFKSVELVTPLMKIVAVTEIGPRIAYFGRPDGENLLYWDKDGASAGEWKLYGGHRVWLTRPMADESVDTYADDNEQCETIFFEGGFKVIAPPHPFTKLKRGMTVKYLADNKVEVTSFIENSGNFIYSGAVWSPTCINPDGKKIIVPLGEDESTWDTVNIVIPRVFAGNKVRIDDPQVTFEGDDMVVRSQGILTKRCVKAPKGIIITEYPKEKLVFEKYSQYVQNGNYPLDGCNLAVFVGENNWMGEMESYGVEQPIKPGQTIQNKEEWKISSI